MAHALERDLQRRLREREDQDKLRTLPSPSSGIDLCSNDYLGWARGGVIDQRVEEALRDVPGSRSGSTGSRLISGNSAMAEALEERIARTHRTGAALVFNSGYAANLGLLTTLCDRHTTVFSDALTHASLIDAARLAVKAGLRRFAHNDLADLEEKLAAATGKKLVVVESVYSMDGDEAPLADLVELCRRHGAALVVDEAHALGVLGDEALGLANDPAWSDTVVARVYTYGKAMACHGAAVVGSPTLRWALVNFARPFIYSTAPPPHQLAAIGAAYTQLARDRAAVEALHRVIAQFRQKVAKTGIPGFLDSRSAVQALLVPGNTAARAKAARLAEHGIHAKAILHPSVRQGGERIRFCLHAFNTEDEVDRLMEVLE